ncbi:MAG: bifunctional transcriptional activator/DNA repair protein Ada [bacterium]|nr:bifunctional transcriptional activator/DNA repair protein Ada [bacterium]
MNSLKQKYYQALLNKNKNYEGIFFVGVITTGIFCRPTCPARKPKFENCAFFPSAEEAIIADFRPCLRCQPTGNPDSVPPIVQILLNAIEKNHEKRWKESDIIDLSVDPSTARRQFQKRFGMTFVQYARAKRMGIAMKNIRQGSSVIQAQLSAGYDSSSGFRDAFSKIMGNVPSRKESGTLSLSASWIDTPLGPMIAITSESALFLLEFVNRRALENEIIHLRRKTKSAILPGTTDPIKSIKQELEAYFLGNLRQFQTPLALLGSPFQKSVWEQLKHIPYGQTQSYRELAQSLGNPLAYRAVANANGANQIAIVIPCHRVINTNGALGGYGGGLQRKEWLLAHEKKFA